MLPWMYACFVLGAAIEVEAVCAVSSVMRVSSAVLLLFLPHPPKASKAIYPMETANVNETDLKDNDRVKLFIGLKVKADEI